MNTLAVVNLASGCHDELDLMMMMKYIPTYLTTLS